MQEKLNLIYTLFFVKYLWMKAYIYYKDHI